MTLHSIFCQNGISSAWKVFSSGKFSGGFGIAFFLGIAVVGVQNSSNSSTYSPFNFVFPFMHPGDDILG